LRNLDGSIQHSFGKFYDLFNVFLLLFGGDGLELLRDRVDDVKEVDWVSGGFMLVKTEVFNKIEGFDENFFMYMEDVEFCYRTKEIGIKVYHYPKTEVLHVGQGSSSRTFAIVEIYKGLNYFYRKHKSYWQYMILRALLFSKAFGAISLGFIINRPYLRETYRKALKF